MPRKKKKKSSNTVTVNFKGVEGRTVVPEGDYKATVVAVEEKESQSGNPYLNWELQVAEGDHKGGKLWYTTSLQPKALWNLRNLLETLGVEVPNDEMELDLSEYEGEELMVTVEFETYEGRKRSRVTDFYAVGEDDESDEDDDEEEVEDDDDEEDDSDTITEEEVRDMDTDELQEVIDKYELDVNLKKFKGARKKVNAVIDALEEGGHLGDDDEE